MFTQIGRHDSSSSGAKKWNKGFGSKSTQAAAGRTGIHQEGVCTEQKRLPRTSVRLYFSLKQRSAFIICTWHRVPGAWFLRLSPVMDLWRITNLRLCMKPNFASDTLFNLPASKMTLLLRSYSLCWRLIPAYVAASNLALWEGSRPTQPPG